QLYVHSSFSHQQALNCCTYTTLFRYISKPRQNRRPSNSPPTGTEPTSCIRCRETHRGWGRWPCCCACWRDGNGRSPPLPGRNWSDRKSTRLNSSHVKISYAVFCLKKK